MYNKILKRRRFKKRRRYKEIEKDLRAKWKRRKRQQRLKRKQRGKLRQERGKAVNQVFRLGVVRTKLAQVKPNRVDDRSWWYKLLENELSSAFLTKQSRQDERS